MRFCSVTICPPPVHLAQPNQATCCDIIPFFCPTFRGGIYSLVAIIRFRLSACIMVDMGGCQRFAVTGYSVLASVPHSGHAALISEIYQALLYPSLAE